MKRITRNLLVATLCLIVLSAPVSASAPHANDPLDINKIFKKDEQSQIAGVSFFSAQEMHNTGVRLLSEAEAGKFDDLVKSYVLSPMPQYQKITVSDLEAFTYNCAVARYLYFTDLAKKQGGNIPAATKSLKHAMEALLYYRDEWFDVNSQIPQTQSRFISDRLFCVHYIAESCEEAIRLNALNPKPDLICPILKICIEAGKQSLDFAEITHPIKHLIDEQKKTRTIFRSKVKMSMFSALVTLADFETNRATQYMSQARKIRDEFKKEQHEEGFNVCQARIDLYEDTSRKIHALDKKSKGKEGPKIKALRDQEQRKLLKKQAERFEEMRKEGIIVASSPENKVQASISYLRMAYDVMKSDDCPLYVKRLTDLEAEIENLTPGNNSNNRDYKAVYGKMRELIKDDRYFFTFFPVFLFKALSTEGDVKGALSRVEAIKELCLENNRELPGMLRLASAVLHNMLGDPTEWIAFEEESKEYAQRKTEEKQAKKKLANQNYALAAKTDAALKKEEQEKKEKAEAVRKLKNKKKKEKKKAKKAQQASEHSDYYMKVLTNEDLKNITQQKAEKAERHRIAEEKRTLNKASKPKTLEESKEPANAPPQVATKQDTLDELSKSSTATMQELFEFKGLPKTLDSLIENGLWRFTREQLKTYFEAMGCEYKTGKGSHEKIDLPTYMKIYQGGELITIIMNESGGALTLPKWEKDHVPLYMKEQILAARLKLRALKIKSLQGDKEKK